METNQVESKVDEFVISCFKLIKQSLTNSVINVRVRTNPILREAERNFSWNIAKYDSPKATRPRTKNRRCCGALYLCAPQSTHKAITTGVKTGKDAGPNEVTFVECLRLLHDELSCRERCHQGDTRMVTSETGSGIPDSNWTHQPAHDTISNNEGARNANHRHRTPREGIKSLLKHSIQMSVLSSKACEESNYSSNSHERHSSLETLLLELLKHQIDAIDVTLSAELLDTCQILLHGLVSISRILTSLEIRSTNRSTGHETYRIKNLIAQLTEAIQLESGIIHESGTHLKNQFLKLQLQALVASTTEPGTFIYSTALKNIIILAENILQDTIIVPLSTLRWEDGSHPLRRIYWLIMQEIYSKADEETELKTRATSESSHCNSNLEDSDFENESPSEISFHDIARKRHGTTVEDSEMIRTSHPGSRDQAQGPKNPDSSSKFGSSTYTNSSNRTNTEGSDTKSYYRRRYRRPGDLLLDMANHVLQLNNYKYTLISKRMSENSGDVRFRELTLPNKADLYLLLRVLKHQIAVLDIVLTSELYDTAAVLIHGIWDTANAILSMRTLSISLPKNENSTPGDEERSSEFGGNVQHILLAIELYRTAMRTKNAKSLKYTLIKLQLDGLLLIHCSMDQHLFRTHLEQLRDECKVLSIELQQKWWAKYFSLNWDIALPEEEMLCKAYWNLMEASFKECGMH